MSTGYAQTTLNDTGGIDASVTSFTLASAASFETAATTTSANLTVLSSSIPVADSSGFPSKGTILIGSEKIRYGTNVGNVFGGDVTRADDGTTAATSSKRRFSDLRWADANRQRVDPIHREVYQYD